MINKFRIGAAGVALISALGMSTAANAVVEPADAEATILAAITITEDASLNFGDIAVNGAGTVEVDYFTGLANCSGSVVCAGGESAGEFSIEGAPNLWVTVSLDNITNLDGPGTDDLEVSYLQDSSFGLIQLDGLGDGAFTVGGEISVSATQPAGVYTGTYDVEVLYW